MRSVQELFFWLSRLRWGTLYRFGSRFSKYEKKNSEESGRFYTRGRVIRRVSQVIRLV